MTYKRGHTREARRSLRKQELDSARATHPQVEEPPRGFFGPLESSDRDEDVPLVLLLRSIIGLVGGCTERDHTAKEEFSLPVCIYEHVADNLLSYLEDMSKLIAKHEQILRGSPYGDLAARVRRWISKIRPKVKDIEDSFWAHHERLAGREPAARKFMECYRDVHKLALDDVDALVIDLRVTFDAAACTPDPIPPPVRTAPGAAEKWNLPEAELKTGYPRNLIQRELVKPKSEIKSNALQRSKGDPWLIDPPSCRDWVEKKKASRKVWVCIDPNCGGRSKRAQKPMVCPTCRRAKMTLRTVRPQSRD